MLAWQQNEMETISKKDTRGRISISSVEKNEHSHPPRLPRQRPSASRLRRETRWEMCMQNINRKPETAKPVHDAKEILAAQLERRLIDKIQISVHSEITR